MDSHPLYGPKIYFGKVVDRKIHIGTSGWSYTKWKGLFYPPKLPSTKWLDYYTGFFSSTEINGSFYRLPSKIGRAHV